MAKPNGIQAEILLILTRDGPLTAHAIYDRMTGIEDLQQIDSGLGDMLRRGKIVAAGKDGRRTIWALAGAENAASAPAPAPAPKSDPTSVEKAATAQAVRARTTGTPLARAFAQSRPDEDEGAETLPIDDDVPGPGMRYGGKKGILRNTLRAMRIGQSFFLANEATTAYALAIELGIAITTRPETSTAGIEGRRVWRVK